MEEQRIENWKVLDSKYIFKDPWLTVRRERVELPNRKVMPDYYVLEYPEWICVIAVTKDGKMLMERQYRHGLGRVDYEICAGVVDPEDITFMDAAKRELMEETGFGNGEWELFMTVSANPSTHTNTTHCFLAMGVEKIGPRHLEATEDIAVELLEPEQVRQLLLDNKIMQATQAAPLWRYFAEKSGAGHSGLK